MPTEPVTAETRIVVIGAGLAAAKAVQTLREEGFDGFVTLIGDEPERPYERPALSKDVLQGNAELGDLFVHESDWYAEHAIDTRFGNAAVSIDRQARIVVLDPAEAIAYDRLLIATGAEPNVLSLPGADASNVFSLRRISDSDNLRTAFVGAKTAVVIGAGWIGLEVAASARAAGLAVTVLESADLPLQRVLGDELAGYFADLHRRNGVDLRTSVTVSGFELIDGRVSSVQFDNTSIPADIVIVGIGVSPNDELAREAGLDVDNGIQVDEHLRTSDPHVFAAGDVANAYNSALRESVRVEHWDNAIRQGQLAARSMLGQDVDYDWQPYFFTDQFDVGMEYVGRGSAADDVVIRGDRDSGEFIAFWLRDGVVTAGMNVNVWDVNEDIRALIGSTVDRARIADTSLALAHNEGLKDE
ncbi:MAG: FAD-dependent oxidoreductase [Aeromicrobium sp.]